MPKLYLIVIPDLIVVWGKAVEIANLDEKKMLETKRYYSENAKLFLFENDEAVKDLENGTIIKAILVP